MPMVDLICRKRDGAELSPEEISSLVEGYLGGEIPDYQMSAFLMAVFFSGMSDREVSAMADVLLRSGEKVDLSGVPGIKTDKLSTGGVGDKTSLVAAPLAASAGCIVPMVGTRAFGHAGGALDKLESIPGFRTNLSTQECGEQLGKYGLCFLEQAADAAPGDAKLALLREATGTVESIPMLAASLMARKLAMGMDAIIVDVKVGSGAFMKKQVDARRLAQAMVGVGRRLDKRVQALITDMNQPLGYAVGNALEVMEVSQTLQTSGPEDLTRLSLELAARMIFLAKLTPTLDDAREVARKKLVDGSAYRKFKQVVQAQGGNPQALEKFELLPNATGMREIVTPRSGYVSVINAEDIGRASSLIGAGRERKDDAIDPAVGVILEVKVGERVDAGSVLARIYYTKEDHLESAAEMIEDAFHISTQRPDERELILEVVG